VLAATATKGSEVKTLSGIQAETFRIDDEPHDVAGGIRYSDRPFARDCRCESADELRQISHQRQPWRELVLKTMDSHSSTVDKKPGR